MSEGTANANQPMRGNVPGIASGVAIIVIAVSAFFLASGLPTGPMTHLGPGAWPDLLAILLFILGLIVVAEGLLRRPIGGGE
jgi:hypothetical protein